MNLQFVIELLLKNKKELDAVISNLKEKHGIDIDTAAADSAISDLQGAVEQIDDKEAVIDADSSGAVEAANDAEAEIEEVPEEHETEISATDNSTSIITAVSTAYMALMQVIGQVKGKIEEMINLSGEQEKSEKLLQVSLANTGDASLETFKKFKDLAASYQDVTTLGDETTMSVMKLGLNMGVMKDDLEEATKGAIGLSKSLDLDLKTAMKMHTLAMDGDYTMLQRYLPALKTAKDDAEKMAIVKKAEANGWKLATAETETGYGALEQYGNTAGDVKEKLGDLVMSAMLPLISSANTYAERANVALSQVNALIKAESLPRLEDMKAGWKGMSNEAILSMLKIQEAQLQEAITAAENPTIFTKAFNDLKGFIEFYYKHEEIILLNNPLMAYNKLIGKFAKKGLDKLIFGDAGSMGDKSEKLKAQLAEIQGAIAEVNKEPVKVVENGQVEKVKELSDELQKLIDQVPEVKLDLAAEEIDTSDEENEEAKFERDLERQQKHLEDILGLKIEFQERGNELNLTNYERQMLAIDEFYAANQDKLIEAGLTEEAIVAQSEQAKDRVKLQYAQRAVSGMSGMFKNIGKVMKNQGKAGFATWKKMAQAQALIDTFKSANSAYASMAGIPVIGPVLGAAAAGAALAAGYVNVREIQKQKFATGGIVTEETNAIIGEAGPEAVVPLQDGTSIPVKQMGGDSKVMNAILMELKAMNINLVMQKKNVTFIIETADPETTVKLLKETENTMNSAGDPDVS